MSINIVVIGAGVSGLTTALELKQSNPNYNISIIAQHLPGDIHIDYTSPFAGANWHSFASHEDKFLQEIDKPAYHKFLDLANNEPRSGIWTSTNCSYFTEFEFEQRDGKIEEFVPWFKDFVEDFKILDKKDLPRGIKFGTSFKGVVISVPIYLNYLLSKNLEIGNGIKRIKRIEDINEARYLHESGSKADLVINATGLLAGQLKGYREDKMVFPVRGQVLHIRNNAKCEVSVEGFPGFKDEMFYLMPRKEGGSIIGGCFLANNSDPNEDTHLTRRIIERAIKYAPELIDPIYKNNPTKIDIVKVNVGLRPFREDGVRVDIDGDHDWLIHNYGIGGGGYQGSYGLSAMVVELAKVALSNKKPGSKL